MIKHIIQFLLSSYLFAKVNAWQAIYRKSLLFMGLFILIPIVILQAQEYDTLSAYEIYISQKDLPYRNVEKAKMLQNAYQHYDQEVDLAYPTSIKILLDLCHSKYVQKDVDGLDSMLYRLEVAIPEKFGKTSFSFAKLLWLKAKRKYNAGNLDEATNILEPAVEIFSNLPQSIQEREDLFSVDLYNTYGTFCMLRNELDDGIYYLNKAKNTALEIHGPGHAKLISIESNLASLYGKLGQFNKSSQLLKNIIFQYKNSPNPEAQKLTKYYFNVAVVNFNRGDYLESSKYVDTVLTYLKFPSVDKSRYESWCYAIKSHAAQSMNNPEEFSRYSNLSLSVEARVNGQNTSNYIDLLNQYAAGLFLFGDLDNAIAKLRESLFLNKKKVDFDQSVRILNEQALIGSNGLLGKIYGDKFQASQNVAFKDSSIYYLDLATKLIQEQFLRSGELARKASSHINHKFYSFKATSYASWEDYQTVIQTLEQKRSQTVLDNMSLLSTDFGGESSEWQQALNNLRDEKMAWRDAINKSKTEKEKQLAVDSLYNIEQKWNLVKAEIKSADAKYYSLMFDNSKVNLQDVKDRLKSEEIIWYISQDDDKVLIVLISKKETKHYNINITNFNDELDSLRAQWLRLASSDSNVIYDELVTPIMQDMASEISRLIIISDGNISRLPFGALRFQGETLVNKMAISYAISLAHWLKPERSQVKKTGIFLANKSADNQLANLGGAQQEAKDIKKLLSSDISYGLRTNPSSFAYKAADYDLLHLAMHAHIDPIDPDSSYLNFGKDSSTTEKLFIKDLYAMNLPARLAFLSACETGDGLIQRSGGPINLSHAFHYAGVPSVVHSLWEIPDVATVPIVRSFYKGLKNGLPKDLALQNAKLEYLSSDLIPDDQKTPFYWAGLVLVGDTASLDFNESPTRIIFFGLLFLLLASFLVYRVLKK